MTTSRSEPQRADTVAMARFKPSPESLSWRTSAGFAVLRYFRHQIDNQPHGRFYRVVHLAAYGQTVRRLYRQNNDIFRDIK